MHGIGQFAMVEYSTLSSISKKVRKQERKEREEIGWYEYDYDHDY